MRQVDEREEEKMEESDRDRHVKERDGKKIDEKSECRG